MYYCTGSFLLNKYYSIPTMQFKFIVCLIVLFTLLKPTVSFSQSIAAGDYFSLFLCSDSTVKACGRNNNGQLGDSTTTDRNLPQQVIGLSQIIAIDAANDQSVALKADGTVWHWGGSQGLGSLIPVQLIGFSNIKQVAVGTGHVIALKTDGTVWGYGQNHSGELGDSTITTHHTAFQIQSLSSIISISAGSNFSIALKDDGTVWALGEGEQLGYGSFADQDTAIQIPGVNNIIQITSGKYHSLGLKTDGTLWGWGSNSANQLFPTGGSLFAQQIPNVSDVVAIGAGNFFSLAVSSIGKISSWGSNQGNQLSISYTTGILSVCGGDEHALAINNSGVVWGCGTNVSGQVGIGAFNTFISTPVQIQTLCQAFPPSGLYNHYVRGRIYFDLNSDCVNQQSEPPFHTYPLQVTPTDLFIANTNSGNYLYGFSLPGSYTISPIIPNSLSYLISEICPPSYTINGSNVFPTDSSGFDFGIKGAMCSHLRVDISSSRRRRCFKNIISVFYINEGLIPANNVEVKLKLPDFSNIISSSHPFTWQTTDSLLVFSIGTLDPFQSGTIYIQDSVSCISEILGRTVCATAEIFPINECYYDSTTEQNWDHSSIKVKGTCINDTLHFVIYNLGSGNMLSASDYRIYSNNILSITDSFQIVSGDSIIVNWLPEGSTIRLEADQTQGHPGNSHPRSTIEGCGVNNLGTFTTGIINQITQDDFEPGVDIDCGMIVDSYDPNEKVVSPEGINAAHDILPNEPLDYTIHFQNTGIDTAFFVAIIDTLAPYLDISTLELGVSSHPYTFQMNSSGEKVLKFIFQNISLIDSFHNEPKSHGCIKYKISPYSNAIIGTTINNSAYIYFDYNRPVHTNNAFVTLSNQSTLNLNEAHASQKDIIVFPNPFNNRLSFKNKTAKTIESISVYSIDGRLLNINSTVTKTDSEIDLSELKAGIYFLRFCFITKVITLKIVKQ
jgi:alpha-tubulin suppressor-like RCC1 family protein